jgi:hypothetical protein
VDPAQVRTVVRAHRDDLAACVARARLKDRDISGKIVMRIALSVTGKVTATKVTANTATAEATELAACFTGAVKSWTFPAPAGGVAAVISYPFSF